MFEFGVVLTHLTCVKCVLSSKELWHKAAANFGHKLDLAPRGSCAFGAAATCSHSFKKVAPFGGAGVGASLHGGAAPDQHVHGMHLGLFHA